MPDEPVQVEVLDQDRRVVARKGGTARFSPLTPLLYMVAIVFAVGILLWAIGEAMQQRARAMGADDEDAG